MGPCFVTYFHSKTNRTHNSRVYWISLYMFRTVFPSIVKSSRLYIQHQVHGMQSTNLYDMYLMLYVQSWTLDDGRKDRPKHVETERLYIHYQVYVIQVSWLHASMQSTNLYDIYLILYVQSWTLDDGRKDRPKHVETERLYIQHQVYVIQVSWLHASGHEMELSSISYPLACNQLTFVTYNWCCMYSLELLTMDGKTVRNM
jgi:hypothetical protein